MEERLEEALARYPFRDPQVDFIRHNENATYRLRASGGRSYVLRIHTPAAGFVPEIFGMHTQEAALRKSELRILQAVAAGACIPVQQPVPNRDGELLTRLPDGTLATLLSWIDGETVENTAPTEELLWQIGETVGRLHRFLQAWPEGRKLTRYAYDEPLLCRIGILLHDAVASGCIAERHDAVLQAAVDAIVRHLRRLDLRPGTRVLAHADLSKSNMVRCDGGIALIDFSLCGFSHTGMDLGSLYSYFTTPEEQGFLLCGYRSVAGETLEERDITPFLSFQVLLFLATHYRSAAAGDWFAPAMDRWCRDLFVPLPEEVDSHGLAL